MKKLTENSRFDKVESKHYILSVYADNIDILERTESMTRQDKTGHWKDPKYLSLSRKL